MSKAALSFSPFNQQTFVSIADSTKTSGYEQMLGHKFQDNDVDVVSGIVNVRSQQIRQLVLVRNGSASAIACGAPLNWVSSYWGTRVQACPVGSQIRCFAPSVINGSTSNTIPVDAYFLATFWGPVGALSDGTTITVNDSVTVSPTAGRVRTEYGLGGGSVFSSTSASAAVTNVTAATAFTINQYTFPVNSLQAGDAIRVRGACPITWNTGTLTLQILIGATVVGTTGAVTNATGDAFTFDAEINVRTAGATGTIVASGTYVDGVPGTATAREFTPLASTAIDTTATQLISVVATWGTANAGNSVVLAQLDVQKFNTAIVGTRAAIALETVAGTGTPAQVRVNAICVW